MKLLRGAISLTLLLFCLFCWPSSVSASSRRRYNRRRRRKYVPPACGAGQRRNYHSATHPGQWYDCTNCVAGRYMPSGTEQLGGYISNIGGGGTSCPSCHQYSCPGICSRGTISAAGATECTSCSAGKTTSTIGATGCSDCSAGKFTSQVGPHENGCVSESQTTMFFFCTNIHKYIDIFCILFIYIYSPFFYVSLFSFLSHAAYMYTWQTANAALQKDCAEGKYTSNSGQTSCKNCHTSFSPGWYQDDTGQITCKQCPTGQSATNNYNANPPSYPNPTTSCTPCLKGRFAAALAAGICVRSYV